MVIVAGQHIRPQFWRIADKQKPTLVAAGRDRRLDELTRCQVVRRFQSTKIRSHVGFRFCSARQRVGAQHLAVRARLAVETGGAVIDFQNAGIFGWLGKALPRQYASCLVGRLASRKTHFWQVGCLGNGPAHSINSNYPLGDWLSGDAVFQQVGQVQCTLAVTCEDDGPVFLDLGDKIIKGEEDIAIRSVKRHLAFRLVSQEGSNRGLSVTRCPDFTRCCKWRGQAAEEHFRAFLRKCIVERSVPVVFLHIGCGVNEEDRSWSGNIDRRRTRGLPFGHIVCPITSACEPHFGIIIDVGGERLLRFEFLRRDKGVFGQFLFINAHDKAASDHQHDQGCDDIKELAGHFEKIRCNKLQGGI